MLLFTQAARSLALDHHSLGPLGYQGNQLFPVRPPSTPKKLWGHELKFLSLIQTHLWTKFFDLIWLRTSGFSSVGFFQRLLTYIQTCGHRCTHARMYERFTILGARSNYQRSHDKRTLDQFGQWVSCVEPVCCNQSISVTVSLSALAEQVLYVLAAQYVVWSVRNVLHYVFMKLAALKAVRYFTRVTVATRSSPS